MYDGCRVGRHGCPLLVLKISIASAKEQSPSSSHSLPSRPLLVRSFATILDCSLAISTDLLHADHVDFRQGLGLYL